MKIERIGRYIIISELGRGAMGVVYKGFDEIIQRYVAIKVIHLDKAMDKEELEESRSRFYRESQAAGKLSHPNIITIYDISEHKGQPFIAMEYVGGESLSIKIKKAKGGLPWKSVVDIFIQVADGLGYAHKKGVIHRDIKPANILISSDNKAKIADFGIAKISRSSLTRTGIILGTPSFMSPEQIKDSKLDHRSDIFSLGATLYQAITGSKPFTGSDISEVISRILHYSPAILEALPPTVPPEFDQVIRKTLNKDPGQRYQNCSQLKADLEQIKRKPATKKPKIIISTPPMTEAAAKAKVTPPKRKKAERPIKEFRRQKEKWNIGEIASRCLKLFEIEKVKVKLGELAKSRWAFVAVIGAIVLLAGISAFIILHQKEPKKIKTDIVIPPGIDEEIVDSTKLPKKPVVETGEKEEKPLKKSIKAVPANGSLEPANILKKEISITSLPDGASIYVDGKDSGLLTPSILQLEAVQGSQHTFTLIKDCYDKASKKLWFKDEEKVSLTFKLNIATYIHKINSKPSRAKIVINGKDTGQVTPAEIQVACGQSYKFTLIKEGFKPYSAVLKDEMTDKTLIYNLEREKPTWAINISSKPKGASIFRNNIDTHLKTPTTLKLQGYKGENIIITIEKKGYKPVSKTVKLGKELKTPLQLNLTAIVKKMLINSTPPGAEVIVDGRKMTKPTPIQVELVGDKSYEVKLAKSGYYPEQFIINAISKEESIVVNLRKLPVPGIMVINSAYKVDIYIEGKLISTPDKSDSIELLPGRYQLHIIKKDIFLDKYYSITISSGKQVNISTPPLGKISIKAVPSNCKIYINGQFFGYPPIFEQPIVVGEHLVTFEWTQFNATKEEQVKINKDQVSYIYKTKE